MTQYVKAEISAETEQQAGDILNSLLEKKLIAGSIITSAPSRFWWKDSIESMDYYTLSAFTLAKHKEAIISVVKDMSVEEVPMIWFMNIDGNAELLTWIEASVE
jgi:uncharacterized protein involved in tolerance to divalent cations